jgi:hypothetical protein
MIQFPLTGSFKVENLESSGIDAPQNSANGAVFACGIHRLEYQ